VAVAAVSDKYYIGVRESNYPAFNKRFFTAIMVLGFFFAFSQNYGEYFRRYDVYGGVLQAKSKTYIYGEKYAKTPSSPAVYDTIGGGNYSFIGPWAGLGLNLPFVTFSGDNMSVGAHIAANVAFGGGTGFLNIPLGLQYRFGTDAGLESDKRFGFSVGGGYNLFLISGDLGEGFFKYPYISPEINFDTQGKLGLLKLKSYIQFTEQYRERKLDTQTLHTYLQSPLIIALGICPNF
jgi:hypothetical protein